MLAHTLRFLVALELSDTAAARLSAEIMGRSPGFQAVGLFLNTYLNARRGDSASVRNFVAFVQSFPPSPTQPGNAIFGCWGSLLLAQLGQRDQALELLEAVQPRGLRLHDMMRLALFDVIRYEPRFQALWNETRAPGVLW